MRTPPGSAGASSPRTRRSPSCARRSGVTFIGPDAEAMRKLGDKIGAKLIAEEVGVPVAPWSRGAVADPGRRPRGGGSHRLPADAQGHRGRRRARHPRDHLRRRTSPRRTSGQAPRRCARSAAASCSLSACVTGARHVEVQVIADGQGTAWALGVRDCSVQRRNQKVIEESASPVLSAAQADELKASAERLALAVGYRGAATVEFLYHPGEKRFAFLEVNTRLQVEHPITELTTGTDLVKAPVARGRGRQARGRHAGRVWARHRGAAQRRGPGPRLRARRLAASPGWRCPRARASASTPGSARATPSPPTSTR